MADDARTRRGQQTRREGPRGAGRSKLVRTVTADETVFTTKREGLRVGEFDEVQWAVIMSGGVTSCAVHFMRLVEVPKGEDYDDPLLSQWVEDDTVTYTASGTYYQYASGQRVNAYVTGFTGTGTVKLVRTGVTKGA